VVVATHDERLLPLADRIVHLSASPVGESRPPERFQYQPARWCSSRARRATWSTSSRTARSRSSASGPTAPRSRWPCLVPAAAVAPRGPWEQGDGQGG
jgi:hypothetical protein